TDALLRQLGRLPAGAAPLVPGRLTISTRGTSSLDAERKRVLAHARRAGTRRPRRAPGSLRGRGLGRGPRASLGSRVWPSDEWRRRGRVVHGWSRAVRRRARPVSAEAVGCERVRGGAVLTVLLANHRGFDQDSVRCSRPCIWIVWIAPMNEDRGL